MIIGVLKEIKEHENRVSMTPSGVEILISRGHKVLVEKSAGRTSGFEDSAYIEAGAEIKENPEDIYAVAEMIMHVKEPQPSEYKLIRENQIIFTYFHFAAYENLVHAFMESKGIALAYETIEDSNGNLPLLTPMSEIAGRMAVQEAAKYLEYSQGGRGILLGGVTGVAPAKVLVLGGGAVGSQAALMACGLGAQVHLLEMQAERLRHLSNILPKNCIPLMGSPALIREKIAQADAVIGAVLLPGAKTPKLVSREMIKSMKKGAVIVDVAIDQGGCFETSQATTHESPVYEIDGVLHYCVSNMPGAVPITATMALTNATLPYIANIADKGLAQACRENKGLSKGINIINGKISHAGVAKAFNMEETPVENFIN